MRKITKDSVNAFLQGRTFHAANMDVAVEAFTDEATLYLHGNAIARRVRKVDHVSPTLTFCAPAQVILSDCGWQTTTTKERLNGVLEQLGTGGCRIYQRDHVWYISTFSGELVWTGGAVFTDQGQFQHLLPVS